MLKMIDVSFNAQDFLLFKQMSQKFDFLLHFEIKLHIYNIFI